MSTPIDDAMAGIPPRSPTPRERQVVYLAGPMRGYAEYNFPAFHAAAAKLRGHGLDVWSPAEHDVNEDGFDPAKDTHQPMRHYMRRDLPAVLDADMVCVLPGWEKSQGAQLEVHVARTCGIPVYNADDLSPVAASSERGPNFNTEDNLHADTVSERYDAAREAQLVGGDLATQRSIHDRAAPSAIKPTVWEVSNRTSSVLFSSEDSARQYLSSHPATVSGGMSIIERPVL